MVGVTVGTVVGDGDALGCVKEVSECVKAVSGCVLWR